MTLAAVQRLARPRGRHLLLAALAVAATGASAAPALAVTPPELRITMTHANPFGQQAGLCPGGKAQTEPPCGIDPLTEGKGDEGEGGNGETFARESGYNDYKITVTNIGETTSSGTEKVTVRDELPAGMVLHAEGLHAEGAEGEGWNCTILAYGVGAECSTSETRAAGASFNPIRLHVSVLPQAANPTTNVATVSGGGAPASASTKEEEGKTTVTEAVPFGITTFTTNVFKEPKEPLTEPLSEPFSQAGGHPFAISTEIVFNYTTSDDKGTLAPAGGAAKEVQAETPPGLTGDVLNAPQCPGALLAGNLGSCPANTAVGYVAVDLADHFATIVGGKARIFPPVAEITPGLTSLVYNMEPTRGSPATFGFKVAEGVPFTLEAKLRSNGDYGVTVGDNASANGSQKLLGVKLTFCENGAEGKAPNFHCKAAPASSKPFVTNPTQCSGPAPPWTILTDPWHEPADYQAKTVNVNLLTETGALSANSFVTGCQSLQFEPGIEVRPSPPSEGGTTQAGQPTGMTVDLKVPQTNEAAVNATPELRTAAVTLPAGMTLSASAANGLQACSNAQFGLGTEFGPGATKVVPEQPAKPASCPPASQVGTAEIFTPLLNGAPTIEGPPGKVRDGEYNGVLSCLPGTWNGSPTLSYQWLRNGVEIPEATGREYTVVLPPTVPNDEGKALQCQVTATNAAGRSVAVSRDVVGLPESSPVPPFPPASIAAPTGTASVPNTLTCVPGTWTSNPEHEPFTYKWLRGGEVIAGAAEKEYPLVAADEGKAIQCQVSATNEDAGKKRGGPVIADSAAVVVSPEPSAAPPLLGAPLQGQLFVGEPECGNANYPEPCTNEDAENGKLVRVFLQAQDPRAGVVVKQVGKGTLNTLTGQVTTTFSDAPQQPFELLHVTLKGGPRATLVNPQSCGTATTKADLTPWSAPGIGGLLSENIPGTADALPSSGFEVTGCTPPQFAPAFSAGTTNNHGGAFSPLTLTFSRTDSDQDFQALTAHTPPGLAGMISSVALCPEAQANAGTCSPASQIGTTEVGSGPGPHPFYLPGKVYLTGPYKGQPFGMSVAVPAVAGPFNLGMVVVRSSIHVDPYTAAVTVTSDPFPKILDGVPTHVKQVNVNINREGFLFNPTNCSAQQISATLTSVQGASAQVSSPFGIVGCTSLPFHPTFTASTGGQASKANGASLNVKVTSTPGQANIAKTSLILPVALPARLTTIQKACTAAAFEANPATCPEGSVVGIATVHTPVLKNPLTGPAYLVSHGAAAFPDVEFLLQGEGVMVILDGKTDIKKGVTYSNFETVPDAPVSTFETVLPTGPHSALTANVPEKDKFSLCGTTLAMPTTITAQNGAVIKQETHIAVTGCPATVSIAKVKVTGNALMVTVKTGATGTVSISGLGLKTTKKNLTAGSNQVRVAFTKAGIRRLKHRKRNSVRVKLTVKLTVGRQSVAKTATVRL